MSYKLTWHDPGKVLLLTLTGDYSFAEAKEVNEQMLDYLDSCQQPLRLLIDTIHMSRPHNFNEIRTAQTFMNHLQLKSITIVTHDRLVKLSMMVIFNMGRAIINLYENMDRAKQMLQYQS